MVLLRETSGMITYDCSNRPLNSTTFFLNEVNECDIPTVTINSTKNYAQLLQINEFDETQVFQCKLEIHRTAYHCRWLSHLLMVNNGDIMFVRELTRRACLEAHKTGILRITDNYAISGIKPKSTMSTFVTFAGSIDQDGDCDGQTYKDEYGGHWSDVIVHASVTITLADYRASISLESNKIRLRSRVACSMSETECFDLEGGSSSWFHIPRDNCKFEKYSILYEGYINKTTSLEYDEPQTVYSINDQGYTFAFTAKGYKNLCGYRLTRTEHPK